MKTLIILGAGGHGGVVGDCAQETRLYDRIVFLDDDPKKTGQTVHGIPVAGTLADLTRHTDPFAEVIVAVGNCRLRAILTGQLCKLGYRVASLIHPRSYVSRHSLIQAGTVVLAGAVINAGAKLGIANIVNTCSSVDHDCVLGDGVHISPGARLGGNVTVGDYSWVCIGANVANNVSIGQASIIAAGAAVVNNIESNVLAAGVPAVQKKRLCCHEEENLFIASSFEWNRNPVYPGGFGYKLGSPVRA